MKHTIYAGTYTSKTSQGIYTFDFQNGKLSNPQLFYSIKNPKYLCVNQNNVVSTVDFDEGSGVILMDHQRNVLDKFVFEHCTSCYITQKGNRLYTANYHEGTFSVLEIKDNHLTYLQTVHIKEHAGCHQVLFWKDLILIPCLFLDQVLFFDRDLHPAGSIDLKKGTGPRHGIFTKDQNYLYLVSELSNELFVISTTDWEIVSSISILPDGQTHKKDTAAIRMNKEETRLYISTRTMDILSVVNIEDEQPQLIQTIDCGGKHPRDFILIEDYLLCANRLSDSVCSFEIKKDGTVGNLVSEITVPECVCLDTP